jgi:predicted metalloprotease with PDZ domain
VVDDVAPASPASDAGIQLGDRLISFGDVTAEGGDALQRVAAVLQVGNLLSICVKAHTYT